MLEMGSMALATGPSSGSESSVLSDCSGTSVTVVVVSSAFTVKGLRNKVLGLKNNFSSCHSLI